MPSIATAVSRTRPTIAMTMTLGAMMYASNNAQAKPVKMTTVEGITEYRLDNGLQVLLFPDSSKPTVTVNVTYRVGSRHEGRGETGMAHLLEHMVFKGTPTYENIWGALEDHGASFNGTTWVDRTNYFETLPANDRNLEFALHMEADRMVNSIISKDELAREMTVVRNEFEMGENNPVGILSERMTSAAFLWHNYGKSTIGNRSDIERVPVENLRRFYKTYYQPDNATLVVAGKFDPQKTLAMIDKHFGAIPKPNRILEDTYTDEPAQDGPRLVTLNRVGDVSAAGLVYHIPAGSHTDFPAIQVLQGVLTSQPSGRLYKALVETNKAASVRGSAFQWAEPGIMQFMAQVRLENNARETLQEMIEIVENVSGAAITSEEVERIKTQLLKNIRLSMNNSGRIGVRLSEAIAQGDWRLFFIHRDRLKNVTVADVSRVAGHYLIESNRTAGLFIPSAQPTRAVVPSKPDITELVLNYKGSEEISEGEAFVATPQTIEERVKRTTLPSGIKLALLAKETRGDAVSAQFRFHFGNEDTLRGHRAAIGMIPSMLMRGTTDLDYQALRDKIDQLQSRIMVGGGGRRGGGGGGLGTVSASIESDRDNIIAAINLLGDIMQKPAFSSDEFNTIMRSRLARSEERLSDPRARGSNEMSRAMNPWPADSIHYVPTLEERIAELRSVSLGTVQDLYKRLYGADGLSIAIVGDFDETEASSAIERVFGSWKAATPYTRVARPLAKYESQNLNVDTPDKEMATVGMSAAFAMRDDHADYPALAFAAYVLGQGGKSRLINRLRHQEGLSYGAGARFNAASQDDRASISASAICAPQNSAQALTAMQEEIQKWIKEGITQEELEEGKSAYALRFENRIANDRFIMVRLASDLEFERTFAYQEQILKDIEALTLSDVQDALNKHVASLAWVDMRAGDLSRTDEDADTKAPATPSLPDRMARFDANGDGKLQKEEAPEPMQRFFDRLDTNNDGAIDGNEADSMPRRRREGRQPGERGGRDQRGQGGERP
ncbi:MAG: insulinase family protein [Planctomycetota bacterium]|jgi:zinc protease